MTTYISLIDEDIHNGAIDEVCLFFLKLQMELQYKCIEIKFNCFYFIYILDFFYVSTHRYNPFF